MKQPRVEFLSRPLLRLGHMSSYLELLGEKDIPATTDTTPTKTNTLAMMLCGLFSNSPKLEALPSPKPNSISSDEEESSAENTGLEAMMRAIQERPQPIIDFAVTQLNAELILFLREATAWKKQWSINSTAWDGPGNEVARVTCYAHAALIFYLLVDEKAYYPINIHPTKRNSLAVLFRLARYMNEVDEPSTPDSGSTAVGDSEDITETTTPASRPSTPWESLHLHDPSCRIVTQQQMADIQINSSEALNKIQVLPADTTRRFLMARHDSAMNVMAAAIEKHIDAPEEMHLDIFDEAIKEARMQAYHNVWLPFVKAREGEGRGVKVVG